MNDLYVISGVAGMTGNELARQILAEKRGTVIGFDNFFCSGIDTIFDLLRNECFHFYEYDLNDSGQMSSVRDMVIKLKYGYDRIIYVNCAAVVHTEYFYEVHSTFTTNVVGMNSFLEQAVSVGAYAYINCSTSEVYSMRSFEEGGVKESDFLVMANAEHSQRTSYACGKLMTEFFMKDAVDKEKIKGCSLRFANVYSKNERFAKHILPHIVNSLRNEGKVTLLENSKVNKRTFLHNNDSCAAVLALIDSPDALDGTVYNVATEEEISIIDLVYLVAAKLHIAEPEIRFEGFRKSDPERRILCTQKIRSRTSWTPVISLSDGIDMILQYKEEHEK